MRQPGKNKEGKEVRDCSVKNKIKGIPTREGELIITPHMEAAILYRKTDFFSLEIQFRENIRSHLEVDAISKGKFGYRKIQR